MASVDGIPFSRSIDNERGGAAFLLTAPSPVSSRVIFDGLEAEIGEKSCFALVRGIGGDGFIVIVRAGLAAILQGLDIFSVKGIADLTLTDATDEQITWKYSPSGPVVALFSTTIVNATISASAVVTDAQGNIRPVPQETFHWHASMRFYRQAQIVDDLADALRNLWLAVENLLDELAPWQSGESEGSWLSRALTVAANHLDLQRYLPPRSQALVTSAYDYFYDELRTHLFHAKGSRHPLLPAEVDSNNDLVHRHERLTRFYLDLLNESLGIRRGKGGGMTYAGFDLAFDGLHAASRLAISDDASPLNVNDSVINPAGGAAVTSPAKFAPYLSRPGRQVFSSRMNHDEASRLEAIRRFGLTHADNALVACSYFEGAVELSGIAGLRSYYSLRLNNTESPRYFPAF